LGNTVAALDGDRRQTVVDGDDAYLASIPGIDQTGPVGHAHPVPGGQTAAGHDEPGIPVRYRHGDPGRNVRPCTGFQSRCRAGIEVDGTVARMGVRRRR